jgi:hypothetical protein
MFHQNNTAVFFFLDVENIEYTRIKAKPPQTVYANGLKKLLR